ncbi:SGNH/GDSL hydrolase family protein [Alteromonas sp. KUL49]|uniref:SGNH/GDSL hydrolase family protein n=1 Tax=Alteromonas sp. KUL49 TaxID=2480798 RepID=UPI00102EDD49|nr:SGNH/GDSL hydrolase family protein [Alteromonas sp. KUL49]TAP37344.1 SGNH/GDSL hydrolase family protein [Alteromonas sp. KUL49]GEA12974.1 lipase [Alteromonas sp. KUL49]
MISFKLVLFNVVLVLLAPVLIAQGKRVRATTPKLPEPKGARQGFVSNNYPNLAVWILGDSAAAGVGVEHQNEALSGQLVGQLEQRFSLKWQLDASTGRTSSDLLGVVQSWPENQEGNPAVLVSIGVNDVTSRASLALWKANIHQIIECLQQRHNAKHVIFSDLPPMGKFPALPQPLRWVLGLRANILSDVLSDITEHSEGVSVLKFDVLQTNGSDNSALMASDGFHPGRATYKSWARVAAEQISSLSQ